MSIQAISWAMMLAPVPLDVDRKKFGALTKPSATCRQVLAALAQHAGPDGRDAFPSVEKLVAYTNLAERTVRTCLDRLEELGVIVPSTSGKMERMIKRQDRRPRSYDLQLGKVRDDLDDELLLELVVGNKVLHAGLDLSDGVQLTQEPEERGATGAQNLSSVAPKPSLNRASSLKEKRQYPRASSTPRVGRDQSPPPPAHDLLGDLIQHAVHVEQGRDDEASVEWIGKLVRSVGDDRQFALEEWRAAGREAA